MTTTVGQDSDGGGTDAPLVEPTDRSGEGVGEQETRRYERSPRDVLRLVGYALMTFIVIALAVWGQDSVIGFEQDLVQLLTFVTPSVVRVIHGSIEWVALIVGLAILVVPLVTKRYRLFGYLVASNALAAVLMSLTVRLVDHHGSELFVNTIAQRAGVSTSAVAGARGLAQFTAAFVVLGPFVTARWRRAGVVILATMLALRMLVTNQVPVNVIVALPLGGMCGVIVLLAFGRPDRRATLAAITAGLRGSGLPIAEVRPAKVDARGSTPYFATLTDGNKLFVKVLGEEQRAADLLFRMYRYLRLKDVGDDRPFSSLRRTVEHEALVSLAARDVGVRTPRMRSVVNLGSDSMLLAYDAIDGSSLDGLPDDGIDDELMAGVWKQVTVLRKHRIAHRDLRSANLFVADDGRPWMIDFGFAELAVEDALLDADVAQLLASFAVVAEPAKVVSVAIESLGRDEVVAALPRLQLNALSGATKDALKHEKGRLKDLQREVMTQTGVSEVHYTELERFDKRMLFTIAIVVAATYFLIPQFSDLPGVFGHVRDADWAWAPLIVAMSVLTYVGASFSFAGAVPDRLAFGPLLVAQSGASFASKLAPAGVGGMALNIRFLEKQGVDRPVAVTGVGLNTLAGFVGHVSLMGVFVVWAGRKAFGSFHLPDGHWFLVGLGIAAVLGGIGLAIPYTRGFIVSKLVPLLRRSAGGIAGVARRPAKLGLLLGGSILVTMTYLLAAYFSIEAFGGGLPLATVGAVYLVAAAVASAAPTPGGLGALEAALIGGLVAAGLANSVAVPAVFLFRLATFWLPILPGWLCFRWMQRREYI